MKTVKRKKVREIVIYNSAEKALEAKHERARQSLRNVDLSKLDELHNSQKNAPRSQ